ncbi:MAG: hypothetical protein IKL00_08875 [Oscillospiraceae bacterium]|nr:hypothetical protein [Oscillospiraceae bacterium]
MNLPEEAYHQSVVYCSQEEEWEVREAVKEYESNRSVCLSYQKAMQAYRIIFLLVNFTYLSSELLNIFLKGKFQVVAVYLLIAAILVIWRKNLIEAAISSLMLLTIINDIDAFAIIPVWVLFAANAYLAYLHEKKLRYLKLQHGYPEFHPLQVCVKQETDKIGSIIPSAVVSRTESLEDMPTIEYDVTEEENNTF